MQTSSIATRLPQQFRKSLLTFEQRRDVYRVLRKGGLNTVCEEARCPNIGECFSEKTATFMIMGDRCTRRCHFCSVTTKKPLPLDPDEPKKLVQAVQELGLDYVVITSVDRDELPDYGASHFVAVINALHVHLPHVKIELLTPDFRANHDALAQILASPIHVFGHNIETVSRLYKAVRPQSHYEITKSVLAHAARTRGPLVKSGMMVGLGETDDEVLETLDMLKDLGVEIVTIGQYLQPTRKHWPVHRYVDETSYEKFRAHARARGIRYLFAGPFVRSSYHAKEAHDVTRSLQG